MQFIQTLLGPLQRHPSVGASTSIIGSLVSWLEIMEPIIRVTGLVIGVLIGIVTLMLKLNELRRSRPAKDDQLPELPSELPPAEEV